MKRFISLILLVSTAFSFAFNANAYSEENAISAEETGLLNVLGITGDDTDIGEYATRAEFCALISKLFKYEIYAKDTMPFLDIDRTHKYFKAMSALYEKGAVKGVSRYSIAPDREITFAEAAVISVKVMGYENYPDTDNTYYFKAKDLGIFDGISTAPNKNVSADSAFRIIYNLLFTPVVKYNLSGESVKISSDKDNLMINDLYDIYEIKGVIEENPKTSLYGESSLTKGKLKISGRIYDNKYPEAEDFIGYPVKAYVYTNDDKDEEIVYAYPDSKKLEITELALDSAEKFENNVLYYEDNEKTQKVKISGSADYIFNGIGAEEYEFDFSGSKYGSLKLIDNNGDDMADVIIVTEYKAVVVQNISASESAVVISEKFGNNININLNDYDCDIKVYKKSEEVQLSSISAGNVLLVCDSGAENKKRLVNIYLCAKEEGVYKGAGEDYISIDGEKISTAPLFDKGAASSYLNNRVNYYVDSFGKVIYICLASGEARYGFIYKAAVDEVDESLVTIKLLNTDNEWNNYVLNERVRVNGEKKEAADIYSQCLVDANEKTIRQLVRYKLDANNKISTLDTAVDTSGDVAADERERDKGSFRLSLERRGRKYSEHIPGLLQGANGMYSWFSACYLDINCPVLVLPDSGDYSQDDVLFYTKSSYITSGKEMECEIYDLTEENSASLMAVYGSASATVLRDDTYVVVDRVTTEIDEDDMPIEVLYGWYKGKYTGFNAAKENAFICNEDGETLKQGDIVRFAKNFSGEVESLESGALKFRVVSDYTKYFTDANDQGRDATSANAYHSVVVGRIAKIYGNDIKLSVMGGNYLHVKINTSANFVVYDKKGSSKEVLSKGSAASLAVGDVVAVRLYFNKMSDAVIYKF